VERIFCALFILFLISKKTLVFCNNTLKIRFQHYEIKPEQDLFLTFSRKKAVDSLEKVAIVPILDMLAKLKRCSMSIFS